MMNFEPGEYMRPSPVDKYQENQLRWIALSTFGTTADRCPTCTTKLQETQGIPVTLTEKTPFSLDKQYTSSD